MYGRHPKLNLLTSHGHAEMQTSNKRLSRIGQDAESQLGPVVNGLSTHTPPASVRPARPGQGGALPPADAVGLGSQILAMVGSGRSRFVRNGCILLRPCRARALRRNFGSNFFGGFDRDGATFLGPVSGDRHRLRTNEPLCFLRRK